MKIYKDLAILSVLVVALVLLNLAVLFANNYYAEHSGFAIHTHTKAICNHSNFCQDYFVECRGDKVERISPITGAAVQFPEDWKDLRNKETRDSLCNLGG